MVFHRYGDELRLEKNKVLAREHFHGTESTPEQYLALFVRMPAIRKRSVGTCSRPSADWATHHRLGQRRASHVIRPSASVWRTRLDFSVLIRNTVCRYQFEVMLCAPLYR